MNVCAEMNGNARPFCGPVEAPYDRDRERWLLDRTSASAAVDPAACGQPQSHDLGARDGVLIVDLGQLDDPLASRLAPWR